MNFLGAILNKFKTKWLDGECRHFCLLCPYNKESICKGEWL